MVILFAVANASTQRGCEVLESLSMFSHSKFARIVHSTVTHNRMNEQRRKYRGFQQIGRILFAEGMYN